MLNRSGLRLVVAAMVVLSATPLSARSQVETVEIPVGGGEALTGRFRDAGSGAPGVLMFPMCSFNGEAGWAPVAERLMAAGVSSLMVAEPGYDQREARADAALAFLRSRLGANAPVAVTGGSCGVSVAFGTALRHPGQVRALVALSGPHTGAHAEFVSATPTLAVFSGASDAEPPSPEWARELKRASKHAGSHVEIWSTDAHGTDYFEMNPGFAQQVADWLARQLKP